MHIFAFAMHTCIHTCAQYLQHAIPQYAMYGVQAMHTLALMHAKHLQHAACQQAPRALDVTNLQIADAEGSRKGSPKGTPKAMRCGERTPGLVSRPKVSHVHDSRECLVFWVKMQPCIPSSPALIPAPMFCALCATDLGTTARRLASSRARSRTCSRMLSMTTSIWCSRWVFLVFSSVW